VNGAPPLQLVDRLRSYRETATAQCSVCPWGVFSGTLPHSQTPDGVRARAAEHVRDTEHPVMIDTTARTGVTLKVGEPR
jgi:hypothetical protein